MTSFADAAPAFVQPPLTAAEKANMKKILEAAQAHIRYRNQTEIVSKAEQMEILVSDVGLSHYCFFEG